MRNSKAIGLLATVVACMALAALVAFGLWRSYAQLDASFDAAFDAASYPDLVVEYAPGMVADDVSALEETDGVAVVETGYASFERFRLEGRVATIRVQSLTDSLNKPEVVEGVLPAQKGEVALLDSFARANDVAVGGTVALARGDGDTTYLATSKLKVVGLVRSAEYLSRDARAYGIAPTGTGLVESAAFVVPESFANKMFKDGVTFAYLSRAGVGGTQVTSGAAAVANGGGGASRETADALAARIKALGETRAAARYEALRKTAQASVDDIKAKVAEAEAALEREKNKSTEGQQAVQDAENALASIKDELVESTNELANDTAAYARDRQAADARLADAKKKLDDAQKAADDTHKLLDFAREVYERDGKEEDLQNDEVTLGEEHVRVADLPSAIERLSTEATAKDRALTDAKEAHSTALSAYNDTVKYYESTIASCEARIAEQRANIEEAEKDLSRRRSGIDDNLRAMRKSTLDLEDFTAELDARKDALARIPSGSWEVRDRESNESAVAARGLVLSVGRFCAALFVLCSLAGAFLCASVVTNLARALARQQGKDGASEVDRGAIVRTCVRTAAIGALSGVACGCVAATLAVPLLVGPALLARFDIARLSMSFTIMDVLVFDAVAVVSVAIASCAARLACKRVLKQDDAVLLEGLLSSTARPRRLVRARLWRRASLLWQLAIETCLNDKRRTYSVRRAVAGMMAAVTCALVVGLGVRSTTTRQFERVYGFDAVAEVNTHVESAAGIAAQALDQAGTRTAPVMRRLTTIGNGRGDETDACLTVPTNQNWFDELFHLRPVPGCTIDLSQHGAFISFDYLLRSGVRVGDVVALRGPTGNLCNAKVLGFFVSYVPNVDVVMGPNAYEDVFGFEVENNALLVDTQGRGAANVSEAIGSVRGLLALRDVRAAAEEVLGQADGLLAALMVAFAAVAFVALVLAVRPAIATFRSDKSAEVEVLRSSGLSASEAQAYVWHDVIALVVWSSIGGAVLGAVIGLVALL